jgi:carbonic anhydrase
MRIEQIFENNRIWIRGKVDLDRNYFKKLSKGQRPEVLYIGCSDSRVTAEELMGVHPGEVFIHRNIANVVPSTDLSVMSVINYAVNHLKVNHVVVCGHYNCGGVNAAMNDADMGLLNPWLRNIKDVYRIHQAELNRIKDPEAKNRRLVELNVQEQCLNVMKTLDVQRAFRERNLTIHGWVFDVHSGRLIDLKIDFPKLIKNLKKIYRFE